MALLAKKMSLPPQWVCSQCLCQMSIACVNVGHSWVFCCVSGISGGWVPTMSSLGYCSFALCFEVGVASATPTCLIITLTVLNLVCIYLKGKTVFPFLLRKSLAFWWELTHIYRSFWLVWSFWQYESMNMQCFSQLHSFPLTSVL